MSVYLFLGGIGKPLQCRRLAQKNYISSADGTCISSSKIDVGKCEGGCKVDKNCCKAKETKVVTAKTQCRDGSSKDISVLVINSCWCQKSD